MDEPSQVSAVPPELQRFMDSEIEAGRYRNRQEVMEAGLRLLLASPGWGGAPAHSPDGILNLDREWRVTAANDTALRHLETSRERALGTTLWELAPGLLGTECEAAYRAAMAGEARDFVGPSAVKPGRWLEARLLPSAQGIEVMLRDVTRSRDAEVALQGTEARFRTLADTVPGFVWFATPDGHLRFLNRRWYEYTGQDLQDALADGWAEALHPDDVERTTRAWAEARGEGRTYEIEVRYRRHDGVHRWFLARAEPLRDAEGTITDWFGTSTDIHDRKFAEAELLQAKARLEAHAELAEAARAEADALYRAYFENTAEALFVMGVREDGAFVVEQLNEAHQKHVGFRIEEVRGKSLDEILPAEMAGRVVAAYREAVEKGEPTTFRDEFELNGRREYWDTVLVPLRGAQGRVTRLVGSARNVTAQVQAEEGLRQAQKMQALGQLAGGIAHDFNNLLGAIVGSLDLVQRCSVVEPSARRLIEGAIGAAERGAKLTGQLLAFSRSQRLELRPVLVEEVIKRARDLLERSLGPHIRLAMEVEGRGLAVLSDPTQLELALLNLAINARDAMPDGGELRVLASGRDVTADNDLADGEYVELAVADTGTGMTPAVMERALEPFFTTKSVGQGTGLGLSQVYGIARQGGGTVRIESREGEGSVVRIFLPRTVAVEPAAERPEPETESTSSRASLLVVDDDPDVRRVLVEALESCGYEVQEAANGEGGLAKLGAGTDLLVVDFAMPGMNGAEFARQARLRHPLCPVVFVSGYSDTAAIQAVAGPEAAMLRKPFRIADLQAVVEKALAAGGCRGA
ncbi:PAS domain-containing protein [Sabulicella glaciei]|uniref:histidine kinase n=1 Tax=Sabulicella glaciei TaxID=2984948 RepID=A0ABT3NQ37_9PROT|nr:PAS domain-containing protein [Roseococcus sp. MDT2-1-1]MCW8084242.1 PAS domain-containing protein [Roseococcus sp. MDT2-1-1]